MRTTFLNFYDEFIVRWPIILQRWEQNTLPFRIISGIISIILFAIIIYLIVLIRDDIKASLEMVVDSVDVPDAPKKKIIKMWEDVVDKLENEDENSYKMAIIEADKLFDDLLKRIGYKGDNMSDRLKQITPSHMANIHQVWAAHKVRNRIAHEPNFHLTHEDAISAVKAYERAFEDLELL
ncbi:hypothetical protein ACFLZ0_03180 [Patescibacteria group bacterium]